MESFLHRYKKLSRLKYLTKTLLALLFSKYKDPKNSISWWKGICFLKILHRAKIILVTVGKWERELFLASDHPNIIFKKFCLIGWIFIALLYIKIIHFLITCLPVKYHQTFDFFV